MTHKLTSFFSLGDKKERLMHKKLAFCVHAFIDVHTKWQKSVHVFSGSYAPASPAWTQVHPKGHKRGVSRTRQAWEHTLLNSYTPVCITTQERGNEK